MTFSGLEILLSLVIIMVLLLLPFLHLAGWLGIASKIISGLVFIVLIIIGLYITYTYYSIEDIPLNQKEAQIILDEQKLIYKNKSYAQLLTLMYSRGNQPDTFEIISDSNVTYQIEVSSYWEDEEKKDGDLLIYFTIDNGYRSAFSPMTDSFIKKKEL